MSGSYFAKSILQDLSIDNGDNTRFILVRFGNVLDSSRSVIPLFSQPLKTQQPSDL
ncbi:MAG: polysaccharide biosynthesis protein [Methylococcales symbiont of Iophon sp. n. MRB-2018]|nr:MAG: polysaccharide biosynthesis protein [Methylococcales symbiont of Iophon sp. n. MRB-2018]KAF3980142.1 MAG: polysaccharide biosynthesis protein [Methylococcales symbiont of Iophon sp. n. MRB-2018]